MVGAGPSFETHIHALRERQASRVMAENLESEEDPLEGLLTWFSIHLEDAETNPQLCLLRDEVMKKRREKQTVVNINAGSHCRAP